MDDERQIVERRQDKTSGGMAVSLAAHAVLVLLLALQLTLDLPAPPKEETVAVELVEPPKPPAPTQPPPAPQPPEKKPRMPSPKPEPPRPKQPQAFEAGVSKPEVEKPEAAAAAQAQTAAAPAQGETKPALRPLTPKTIDVLRARLQASEAEQAGKAAAETPAESRPEDREDSGKKTGIEQNRQEEAKADTGRMVEAKEHFSKRMLSDPRVKAALGKLPPERRIVQICSIEALEQVRHALPDAFPDLLVPFSTGGGLIEDHVLTAGGGAYRSQGGWFGIDFRCAVDAGTTRIVSFRFEPGAAIPRHEWARRKLPAE